MRVIPFWTSYHAKCEKSMKQGWAKLHVTKRKAGASSLGGVGTRGGALDFKKMESFLVLANTGKYTTAAEKLYMSQSSLSKQIARLEGELGCKLFKKTGRGVELTPAGWEFYSYAHKALRDYRAVLAHIGAHGDEATQVITVGALPLTEEYGISAAFSRYWVKHPSMQIDYHERNQEDLLAGLALQRFDLVLARIDLLDKAKYAHDTVLKDEMVVVCPTTSPLAQRRSIDIASLRSERFILLEEKSDITQVFLKACDLNGFRPHVPHHLSRHRPLLQAVQGGMGITVLPRRLLTTYYVPDLVGIPFKVPLYSKLGFVHLMDATLTDSIQNFITEVSEDIRQNAPSELRVDTDES